MKHLGHVGELGDTYFIIKMVSIPKYYKIPRDKVISYQRGEGIT